ncbi:MAG: hypothetical protein ACREBB_08650 [Nitrosotalea sp.]
MVSKKIGIVIGIILIAVALSWVVSQRPTVEPTGSILSPTPSQNPYLQEYSLPADIAPNGLIVDKQGTVWITSTQSDILYSFDQKSGQLESHDIKYNNLEYSNPGQNRTTMTWTVIQDKDGLLWFSPLGTQTIWRFDPVNDTFLSLQSKTGSAFQMKADKNNGDVWFTTLSGDTLCVVEKNASAPTGYSISAFDLGNNTAPAGLFLQNNTVWVTEITTQQIVEFNIDHENGTVTGITKVKVVPVNNQTELSSPTDLLVNNGTIWLTEHGTSFLTKYDLGTNQIVRYPTSQNMYHAVTLPFWIRGINDGKDLWFNEHEGNKLAYFDTVNKTMIEYEIPSRPTDGGYLTYPLNLSVDPNDNMILWFSEWNTDKLGRIDGHVQVPFDISADTDKVVLNTDASKEVTVNLKIDGQSPYSANHVFLNASSSLDIAAGFENLDATLSPDTLDLSSSHQAQLLLRNYSATPGNYTLGVSVSDGFVTKTIFLDLIIPKK